MRMRDEKKTGKKGKERIALMPAGRRIPRDEIFMKMEKLEAGEFMVKKESYEQCSDSGIAIKCPHCRRQIIIDVWREQSPVSRITTYRSMNDYKEHRRLMPRM